MRDRRRILTNLESLYRSAFQDAESGDDASRMSKLDFDFQRDQLMFEILLDIRDSFTTAEPVADDAETLSGTLLDKAEKLRRITKLR